MAQDKAPIEVVSIDGVEMFGPVTKDVADQIYSNIRRNQFKWDEMIARFRGAMYMIKTKFDVLNEQFMLEYDHNPIETIKTRIKSPESIAGKLIKQGFPLDVEHVEDNIHDIAGVRVICSFREDIYLLAECLKNQDDVLVIGEKDYIKHPKENGYRSLHLIVEVPIYLRSEKRPMKVEVQLRTIAMDFWASLEHKLRYKKDIAEKDVERLGMELKECAEIAAELDERMQITHDLMLFTEGETVPGSVCK